MHSTVFRSKSSSPRSIHTRYDDEGNRESRYVDVNEDGVLDAGDTDITEYSWDSRNRLVRVTDYATCGGDATQIVTYCYDAENRLVGEKLDSNGDGVVDHQTYFVYDGRQIALQFDKDGTGDVTGANLSHRYLWGPAVNQALADEQVANPQVADNVVWPLADNLSTVRDLAVSQNGVASVANHRVFDSYGCLVSQTNAAVDFLFGFTGFLTDNATGLDISQTRPFDPRTARWTQEDRIGLLGRDPNRYRYCGNSPTNFTDPTGLAPPVPPEPEHGFLWWLWNWLTSTASPPPVAAAEGAGEVAGEMMIAAMERRLIQQTERIYGENSPEADYARKEIEAAKAGRLREFSQQNPPPPPRPGFPPYAPWYQGPRNPPPPAPPPPPPR